MSERVSGERNKQRKKEGAMYRMSTDDVYEMIPIDETKGHPRLDVIWK